MKYHFFTLLMVAFSSNCHSSSRYDAITAGDVITENSVDVPYDDDYEEISDDSEVTTCRDNDGDGFLDIECGGDDCDDSNENAYPGAEEICYDGVDQDCDGLIDGPLFEISPKQISSSFSSVGPIDFIWTGSVFGVVWEESRYGSNEVVFTCIDVDGNVNVDSFDITDGSGYSGEPSIAWSGSIYGIAWHNSDVPGTDIFYSAVNSEGSTIVSPTRITSSHNAYSPQVLYNGSGFSHTWMDSRGYSRFELYYSCVSMEGVKTIDDTRITNNSDLLSRFDIILKESNVDVVWDSGSITESTIKYSTFGFDGTIVVDGAVLSETTYNTGLNPDAVVIDDNIGLIWEDYREDAANNALYYARYNGDGERDGEEQPIVTEAGVNHASPSIVWNGSNIGAVWIQDNRDERDYLMFTQINEIGDVVGDRVQVAESVAIANRPEIAWAESQYGLLWTSVRPAGGADVFYMKSTMCD